MSALVDAMVDLNQEKVFSEIEAMRERGADPLGIVRELQEGMRIIGERFEAQEYYLSELIMSANIFKKAIGDLEDLLGAEPDLNEQGTFVIGTVAGDIHDIGKNIVATVLSCHGFKVVDLGEDVGAERFVEAVRQHKPQILGLSCLLTTGFDSMKSTVEALEAAKLRDGLAVLIGGAPCTEQTRAYVGADAVCLNAHVAVETAKRVIGGAG